MSDKTANLKLGGALSVATAALLATQAPFSVLAAQHLSLAIFVGVTALALLICVPFMLVTKKARADFWSLVSSLSYLGKFAVLLLIGLAGQALYAVGLGKGHPVVVAAVLNLDPFWAALIAFLILGKTIPTSRVTFCACLIVAFVGALAIAVSQSVRRPFAFDCRLVPRRRDRLSNTDLDRAERHTRRQVVRVVR